MSEKLYRSHRDRIVAGVCGGLAEYLRFDATLIRLLFVLLALGSGIGLIAYLVLWVVIPAEGHGAIGAPETIRSNTDEVGQRMGAWGDHLGRSLRHPTPQRTLVVGGGLVFLGFILLMDALDLRWLRWLDFGALWPLALIALGALFLWRRTRE